MRDWKHWLPWRMDGGPAPKECYPPWQQMAPSQTLQDLPLSLSTAAGQHGVPRLWLIMSLHPPAASAIGYSVSARPEWRVALLLRPAVSGSNLAAGRTVFCRPCLPVPGAQDFPPAASWWHCQGPLLQVSWSLHSPYTGSSVKAWVWWLKAQPRIIEFISGSSFATYIILPGPAPHVLHFPSSHSMGKWIQLLHPFQTHSAWAGFVSIHLRIWGVLDQCKQFFIFEFVESFLFCASTSDIYIFMFFS